jgi:hypothetical protein
VFEPTVISLCRVVGMLLDVMPGRGDELVEHRGVDRGGVGDHLAGSYLQRSEPAAGKTAPAAPASRPAETSTSMTCPYWSTALDQQLLHIAVIG